LSTLIFSRVVRLPSTAQIAIGGVVNFVTRKNFSGVSTQARGGSVTSGDMG